MTTSIPLSDYPTKQTNRLDHLSQAVIEVLDLAEPLARDCGTQILVALPPRLPVLAISAATFHDLLLQVLALVLDLSCGESTNLQVRLAPGWVEFEARSLSSSKDRVIDPAALAKLRLEVETARGMLEDTSIPSEPSLCMRLPVVH
jgi:hypothetical protein